MNRLELIGQISALYLSNQLASDEYDGTARFIIDCLTSEQTSAIAKAILGDSRLKDQIEIKLPRHFVEEHDLPDLILTDERATYYRNAFCSKQAILVANTGDDEEQSLTELVPIGAPQLQNQPELWVKVASEGLLLTDEQKKWWEKALTGLQDLRSISLDRLANYVLATRYSIKEEGEPLITALGASLPSLQIPRDTNYFNSINDKVRGQASRWKTLYDSASKKRACYLQKQTTSQLLLSEDDLLRSFEKVSDSIPESDHERVRAFIAAPSGWNAAAAKLAECEWESIKPLFDGLRREAFNLGKATIEFFDELEPELLNDNDKDYLKRLIDRRTTQSEEEDELFYDSHRNELKTDRKLKSAWDKFVFGKARETDDFLIGLTLCFESLFSQFAPSSKRQLKIRCDRKSKRELKDLNVDAGTFFARRYRGLRSLFGQGVSWDVGSLFEFDDLIEQWKGAKTALNKSAAKAALQLKFIIELEVELFTGGSEVYFTQLIWKFNPECVVNEQFADWDRLVEHPLVLSTANRQAISSKGQFQTIDLCNIKTFVPVFGQDRGSFVPVYNKTRNIAIKWLENLEHAKSEGLISIETAKKLRENFQDFQDHYSSALRGFAVNSVANKELVTQLQSFARLLNLICVEAKGDRNRELLLKPLLQIGAVNVEGGSPVIVIAPWHPLRLAALRVKALLIKGLINHLLTAEQVHFGDSRLYFKEVKEELEHAFYPEVVLGWEGTNPVLLSSTDVAGDYSLHEMPLVSVDGSGGTNENPIESANRVMELIRKYLALYPHEQANLSVVLYNSDSARFPQAVMDKISSLYEDDEDIRCQIILRHRESKRLRALYEKIVETSDTDIDSFNASEATRDFMARLRIGIMADQAPAPDPKDGFPSDIVFSQDVIARHARLEWYYENSKPIELEKLVPARWSRRRPSASDDMKSAAYLCCPVQSYEGWTYLTAVTSFIKGDWDGDETRRLLPARQLNFQDTNTAQIFEETHNLANWVVNFDELLDRRQLLNQHVKVIRYKQSATQGRSLIVSSKAPLGLLRSMVLRRIKNLNLNLNDNEYKDLAERFIQDANDISGDIVLRAAKRGRNASELMGVVLSRYLIKNELGVNRHLGWYFLDDYADWLGQREEQIADILTLSPQSSEDGKLKLDIIIVEAKYIDSSGLSAKRKESQKQLRDTVKRINEALFGNPERLDRDLWLARISDLILDGVKFPAQANLNLSNWRRAVREGECDIFVRGYSHVFISGPSDGSEGSDFVKVADTNNSYQEVFSWNQVSELVFKYHTNQDPSPLRLANADEDIWESRTYKRPSDRVEITERIEPQVISQPIEVVLIDSPVQPNPPIFIEPAIDKNNGNSLEQSQGTEVKLEVTKVIEQTWAYPKISHLLVENHQSNILSEEEQIWLKGIESRTKGALQQFQLNSKLESSVLTPNAALLKFVGSSNLTVEQLLKRRSEFLTTYGLNIISVRPEPGIVAVAIERPQRQIINIQDLWANWTPNSEFGNQELLIGIKENDGQPLYLSPGKEHAPHTLIAGSTGSGKSVLMQNIILGIAATNRPNQAKIILIDPKQGVDYFSFDTLPHLEGGLIDNQDIALVQLENLIEEMDNRYRKFRDVRTPNLKAYNEKVNEFERLPYIWLIHDEFAEWMLVEEYKEHVTSFVGRLGVKARAAGIYLVFAAQRPEANIMPMQLRANLGNRLILRVDSEGTSEIALGEKGAERLLGKGHLLAKLEGSQSLLYAQVPFVNENFMDSFVSIISS